MSVQHLRIGSLMYCLPMFWYHFWIFVSASSSNCTFMVHFGCCNPNLESGDLKAWSYFRKLCCQYCFQVAITFSMLSKHLIIRLDSNKVISMFLAFRFCCFRIGHGLNLLGVTMKTWLKGIHSLRGHTRGNQGSCHNLMCVGCGRRALEQIQRSWLL